MVVVVPIMLLDVKPSRRVGPPDVSKNGTEKSLKKLANDIKNHPVIVGLM